MFVALVRASESRGLCPRPCSCSSCQGCFYWMRNKGPLSLSISLFPSTHALRTRTYCCHGAGGSDGGIFSGSRSSFPPKSKRILKYHTVYKCSAKFVHGALCVQRTLYSATMNKSKQ